MVRPVIVASIGSCVDKAMLVIPTKLEEVAVWMRAPWEDANSLQKPLPDGALQIVARGIKKDGTSDYAG